MMRNVWTKTFDNEDELNNFVNENVGDKKFWEIRPQWVNVNGLTMTIVMRSGNHYWTRASICNKYGFTYERKSV